jgi:hybrid cluster-associated redox disulfide protein
VAGVNKDLTIAEVLKMSPKTVQVFLRYGMHCFGCHMSVGETVEQAAMAHQADLARLIKDLNTAVASG